MNNILQITFTIAIVCLSATLSWGQRDYGGVENRGQTNSDCMNIDFVDGFYNWNLSYWWYYHDEELNNRYTLSDEFQADMSGNTPEDPEATEGRFVILNSDDFKNGENKDWIERGVNFGSMPTSGNLVRLGGWVSKGANENTRRRIERMTRTFMVTEDKTLITFYYAYATIHSPYSDYPPPNFSISVTVLGANNMFSDTHNVNYATGNAVQNETLPGHYIPWQEVKLDLSEYIGQSVSITINNDDGEGNGHSFSNSYFSGFCSDEVYNVSNVKICYGLNEIDLQLEDRCGSGDYTDHCTINSNGISLVSIGNPDKNKVIFYVSQTGGNKYIELVSMINGVKETYRYNFIFDLNCEDEFAPCPIFTLKNKEVYHLSFWVKNEDKKFTGKGDGAIFIDLAGQGDYSFGPFKVDNPLYGQWQKVEGSFEVPNFVWETKLKLVNLGGGTTHIDDIRLIPNNANALTYIYDPVSKRLIAELDDNNFATFYEYDEEGNLTRIKKETQRGIKTLKESRRELLKPIKSNTINLNDSDIKFNNLD